MRAHVVLSIEMIGLEQSASSARLWLKT